MKWLVLLFLLSCDARSENSTKGEIDDVGSDALRYHNIENIRLVRMEKKLDVVIKAMKKLLPPEEFDPSDDLGEPPVDHK